MAWPVEVWMGGWVDGSMETMVSLCLCLYGCPPDLACGGADTHVQGCRLFRLRQQKREGPGPEQLATVPPTDYSTLRTMQ